MKPFSSMEKADLLTECIKLSQRLKGAEKERDALAAQVRRMKSTANEAYASYAACHDHECATALTRLINEESP